MPGETTSDPLAPPAWVSPHLWATVVTARDRALAAGTPWEEAIIEARQVARGCWPALPMTHLREAVHALERHPLAVAEIEAATLRSGGRVSP